MKELVKKLNDLKLKQKSYEIEEDLPDDIFENEFKESKIVAFGLNRDRRRWYELSTNVYEINGKYLGVRMVSDVYGNTEYEDVGYVLEFMEMEAVPSVTYRIKTNF